MTNSQKNCTIGIDVSKETLDIWILPNNKHCQIKNNARAIGEWIKRLSKQYEVDLIVLEPTGGYEKVLIKGLLKQALPVSLVHPTHLHHFSRGRGREVKTDKCDAMQLSEYGRQYPELRRVDENYLQEEALQELSSRRTQLKQQLQAERCRIQNSYIDGVEVKRSCNRLIKALEKEVERLNILIAEKLAQDEEKQRSLKILQTFKGVGQVTGETLMLHLPELGRLSKAEIAKLVGVAPINRDSGKKVGKRCTQGGRRQVRSALYMAAMVAIRFNEEMKQFYDRLKENGKAFKVAIIAVMRKMICILNAMLRDQRAWHEQPISCP